MQARINTLKTTDILKKEELQEQLLELGTRDTRRLALRKAQIDSLRTTAMAFPVRGFFSDTLFLIYGRLGSLSSRDRANVIGDRIHHLASDFSFHPDSIRAVATETTIDLIADQTIILSVSKNDAVWNNMTAPELAATYRTLIGVAVMQYKAEVSLITLAKEIELALLTLLIIGVLIIYIGKFFNWTAVKT